MFKENDRMKLARPIDKLAKGIAKISARNIYGETMRRFSEIFRILLH